MSHIVYKVTGKYTEYTYYGYCDSKLDPREAFLTGATRQEEDRGDVRFIYENSKAVHELTVTALHTYDDELDALVSRNNHRAGDHYSITGPTMFPGGIASRAGDHDLARWRLHAKLRQAKTAKEAYQQGAFGYNKIKELCSKFGREKILSDLDYLSPSQFSYQYEVLINP